VAICAAAIALYVNNRWRFRPEVPAEMREMARCFQEIWEDRSEPPSFGRGTPAQIAAEFGKAIGPIRYPGARGGPWEFERFREPLEKATGLRVADLDAAEALVFWLGGLPNGRRLTGFADHSLHPLQSEKAFPRRRGPFFAFDPTRLSDVDGDGWLEYSPYPADGGLAPPYVYFNSAHGFDTQGDYIRGSMYWSDAYVESVYPLPSDPRHAHLIRRWGLCVPYHNTRDQWYGKNRIVISAGADRKYGGTSTAPRILDTGEGFSLSDCDNPIY
jgi:hypothetical protein